MGAFVIVHDKIDSAGVVVGRRARVALDDLLDFEYDEIICKPRL